MQMSMIEIKPGPFSAEERAMDRLEEDTPCAACVLEKRFGW